jgi:hypothetical protein
MVSGAAVPATHKIWLGHADARQDSDLPDTIPLKLKVVYDQDRLILPQ